MKRTIYTTHLLSTLLTITITQNAHGMHTASEMANYVMKKVDFLVESFITYQPVNKLMGRLCQHPTLEAPKIIADYVTKIAKERGIDTIKISISNGWCYGMNPYDGIIYISISDSQKLEYLLNNNSRTIEEEKKLNYHIGCIHHEITHYINKSQKRIVYDIAFTLIGSITIGKIFSQMIKNHISSLKGGFAPHIVDAIISTFIARYLTQIKPCSKYDELKADDGIPNKKELLIEQAEDHEFSHNLYLQEIDIAKEKIDYKTILYGTLRNNQFSRKQLLAMKMLPKSWFNKTFVMDIVFYANTEHPSCLHRAERFRNRIAELDKISSL